MQIRNILLLVLLTAFVACHTDDTNEDNTQKEIEEKPVLISFDLLKENNSFLESDIHFEADTLGDTIIFNAHYLKWIDSKPVSFKPSFSYKGKKLFFNGIEAVSGVTEVSFTDDILYTFEGSKKNDKIYIIRFICPQVNSELPVIRFGINSDDITSKESYITTSIEIYSQEDPNENCYYGDGKIRGRGNSTWLLPKKPYRIKFPEKVSPLGLSHAKAKDWVILGHDMDKSLIRNHLAFKISEVFFDKDDSFHSPHTITFTPSSQFVNVYFGDEYHGVYQFTDQKEKGKGRIDVETLGTEQGDDINLIRGGHVLETVYLVDNPAINFTTKHGIRIDHKYPKDDNHTEAQYKYIEEFVKNAEEVLYGNDSTDPIIGWRHYFDEHSLANYILIKELCGDMDGYISTQMYKTRESDKLFFGPVWDVDKGWGNDVRIPFPDYPPTSSLMIFAGFRMPGCEDDWYCQFWKDADFRLLVYNRWKEKREEVLDVVLHALELTPKQMSKSIEANFLVWPFDYQECSDAPAPQIDYDKEIARIKRLTHERVLLLDKLLSQ